MTNSQTAFAPSRDLLLEDRASLREGLARRVDSWSFRKILRQAGFLPSMANLFDSRSIDGGTAPLDNFRPGCRDSRLAP